MTTAGAHTVPLPMATAPQATMSRKHLALPPVILALATLVALLLGLVTAALGAPAAAATLPAPAGAATIPAPATAGSEAAVVAVVADEPLLLRNAATDVGAVQATLWRGDWLEVRGHSAGFLKVWDHRHERPGYVRPGAVRLVALDPASAPGLRAVIAFLRDRGGMESLTVGLGALYLRVAPVATVAGGTLGADPGRAEVWTAIGTVADRLARRMSARAATGLSGSPGTLGAAGALDVARSYGVRMVAFEKDGRTWHCYDGEAWRRVLAEGASTPHQRATAALALTDARCADPAAGPTAEAAWHDWRLATLDHVGTIDRVATGIVDLERDVSADALARIQLRRAESLAWQAYRAARLVAIGAADASPDAATRKADLALRALALADRSQLLEEHRASHDDVSVRVAAVRHAVADAPRTSARLEAVTRPGEAGQTCVTLRERGSRATLAERCTYGLVWPGSLQVSARTGAATVATLAVQTTPTWTELWLFRRGAADASWDVAILSPATIEPGVGTVESAGFAPDGSRALVVRRAIVQGALRERYEMLDPHTGKVEAWADRPGRLKNWARWVSPSWLGGHVGNATVMARNHAPDAPRAARIVGGRVATATRPEDRP